MLRMWHLEAFLALFANTRKDTDASQPCSECGIWRRFWHCLRTRVKIQMLQNHAHKAGCRLGVHHGGAGGWGLACRAYASQPCSECSLWRRFLAQFANTRKDTDASEQYSECGIWKRFLALLANTRKDTDASEPCSECGISTIFGTA